jgi:hypothetical protein
MPSYCSQGHSTIHSFLWRLCINQQVYPYWPFSCPDVKRQLEKAQKAQFHLDVDWVNAFHQVRLTKETSERLSVQTPWGQVQPRFMPDGIGPASGILQSIVASLFEDFGDFVIAIFDILFILGEDYNDARRKMDLILDRCIERNVFLKLSKSWLGFESAKLFGCVCRRERYELSDERKAAIKSSPNAKESKADAIVPRCLFIL